jgi:hypothetical protein
MNRFRLTSPPPHTVPSYSVQSIPDSFAEDDIEEFQSEDEYEVPRNDAQQYLGLRGMKPLSSTLGGEDIEYGTSWLDEEEAFAISAAASSQASRQQDIAIRQTQRNFLSSADVFAAEEGPPEFGQIPAGCSKVSDCIPEAYRSMFPFPYFNRVQSGMFGIPW